MAKSADRNEVYVDTDILTGYLERGTDKPSALKQLMHYAVCFTSVLNAGELIAVTAGEEERRHAESVLWGLKVLGFHHKYSLQFGDIHRTSGAGRFRDSMVAGMCIISSLPLVTCNTARYAPYTGLALVDAAQARKARNWDELLQYTNTIE